MPPITPLAAAPGPLARAELEAQLRALGVRSGAPLMVHASLRRIGPVEGGADGVIDAILHCLQPGGTMLMVLGEEPDAVFDALSTPADPDVGTLAEIFRQREGVRVNDHAAARFAAWGPQSLALLEPAPLHDYYASGSVLSRLVELNGSVLRLGADADTVTLTHYAEYLARVPDKRRVRRRYVRADTGEQWIDSLDDCDGIADWEEGDYFPQVLIDFLADGRARTAPVGNCTAELFQAAEFTRFAVRWLEANLG